MSEKDDKEIAVDRLFDAVEKDGCAVASVNDGYLLIFKRITLQKILDDHPDKEKMIIFVKREDLN